MYPIGKVNTGAIQEKLRILALYFNVGSIGHISL